MADTTNIGNIEFDLNLDTKGLQRGAKKAESVMSRLDRTFQQLGNINQAGEMITRTGKALFNFGRQFIDSAAQIERFTAGLTSVTGSADEAQRQLKRLREVAKLPGLGFPEAVEGSTNLQAAGFSAGQAEESLRAFGNALASVGKGKAELDGVILALSQMAAKGKLSAEEINQIAERVPQIRQVMKDAFGTAIPKDIEAMGISIDDFVSGVNKSLLKIPPVAQTASNAFENFGDTLNQLRTTIGNMALPEVTRLTTDWTDKISQLNEMLMPANERLEAVGNRISAMTTSFKAQNTETETLITRYGEIQTALADANLDTEEAERLHDELLKVVKSLKEQLPGLIGLWGDEGGSIEVANAALARRLELQKRLVRNEFTKELKRSTKELKTQAREIKHSQENIEAYQKTLNAFDPTKGYGKLGGQTFKSLQENEHARERFLHEMSRGGLGQFQEDARLMLQRLGDTPGQTVGDFLGGMIGSEEADIQAAQDSMAGLSMQLENLVRVSGDADINRFEQLISTFNDLQTSTQAKAWNLQLEILAKNLGLSKEVLTDFIRLAKDASQLPAVTPPPAPAKDGLSEAEKALKAKKAIEDATKAREEAKARQMQGEADLRAQQEMLRKLQVKLDKEVEEERVAEAEKTAAEIKRVRTKMGKDLLRQNKERSEQAFQDNLATYRQQLEREAEASRQAKAKELEERKIAEDQYWNAYVNASKSRFKQLADARKTDQAQRRRTDAIGIGVGSRFDRLAGEGSTEAPKLGLVASEMQNITENKAQYVSALADITDATAEWAEVTGQDGLAKALDAGTIGLDLLTTAMTQGPVMAAFQGVGMAIQHFTEKARKEAEKQKRIADELLREQRELWQAGNQMGFSLIDGLAAAASSGKIDDFGEIMHEQINAKIVEAIMGKTLQGNEYQDAFSKLNDILKGGLQGSAQIGMAIAPLEELRGRFNNLIENDAANARAAMKALDIVPESVEKEEGQVAKGLSVAIRNITVRQADALTRVLRGQMSLLSQVAGNPLRSAVALETYLPSVSNTFEQNQGRPAAEQVSSFNTQRDRMATKLQGLNLAMGGVVG